MGDTPKERTDAGRAVDLDVSDQRAVEPHLVDLRMMTAARVSLGRSGGGMPTRAAQAFLLDHARAREAVWSGMDSASLRAALADLPNGLVEVASEATDRSTYLRRPDLGRRLSSTSKASLALMPRGFDVVIIVADGLSASAVNINAAPLVRALVGQLTARGRTIAPIVLATQARVALCDPIGEALAAQVAIMLIGERPGLSASDSLGTYLTYQPRPDTPDSRRNCVSNIREGGLSIAAAAAVITTLAEGMMVARLSGVGLKEVLPETRAPQLGTEP